MNQKQVKNLFKDSEKKNISRSQLPSIVQKKLNDENYTLVQEPIRSNADLLLLQDKISEEPVMLLLLEKEPYEVEIIKEFC
jgi:hypothetical protein